MHNIAVIGCGIIGLTTATVIQNEFKSSAKVTIFTEKLSPNTTSDIAAGIWGPHSVQNTKPKKMKQWGKVTHDHLLHLWKSGLAAEAGIILQPVHSLTIQRDMKTSDHEDIVYGLQEITPHHMEKLRMLHKKDYRKGYSYVTFICEPQIHLPFLQKQFVANGGIIKIEKINDFRELSDYDIVINCTGINAKDLCNDKKVLPIRGQLARIRAPWQFHAIFSDINYIVPNCNNVILGGTAQLGDWETNPRGTDTTNILSTNYTNVPTLKHAPILFHKVGLRPGRTEARLELELMKVHGKQLPVVHNYGHGGSGVTFSYGCASESLDLVKEVLSTSLKSKL